MAIYYVNGEYLDEGSAKIPVSDLGIVRGLAVFDYLRTYEGHPFHLEDHLLRLKYSAQEIGLALPCSLKEIGEIVVTLLKKNGFKESSVKIILTGGSSCDGLMPEGKPSLMVLVSPLKAPPKSLYIAGIKAITTPLARPVPCAKTTHYISAIIALKKARDLGCLEAIYISSKGEILEGTTSNFFGVKNGKLITPAAGEILLGITREVILRLCPCEARPILYEELKELDEAFFTSSNREILPVVQIDGIKIGSGKVGPMTQDISRLFREYTNNNFNLKRSITA